MRGWHFKDCKSLITLNLYATPVGDSALVHFKDCKDLTYLQLYGTPVGDAGLAHFKDCKNLAHLGLSSTKATDAGLAHFQGCKKLTSLQTLKLTGCSKIGPEHVQLLRQSLPTTAVSFP